MESEISTRMPTRVDTGCGTLSTQCALAFQYKSSFKILEILSAFLCIHQPLYSPAFLCIHQILYPPPPK